MSPQDIRKLLGGYATGTLTPEEQQALFAAALEDQELFDALAQEQPLRDLLTDPSARATLLSSLDTTASRLGGFWQSLRGPAVAGLAVAGVVAIAVVAVWQGTRIAGVKPADRAAIVAELRPQEQPPALPAPSQPAGSRTEYIHGVKPTPRTFKLKDSTVIVDRTPIREPVEPVPPPLPPPPAPAAMPALMARKAETDAPVPAQKSQMAGAAPENSSVDARALFYANQVAQTANGFRPLAAQADAATRTEKAASGLITPLKATVPRLGVRISILRGNGEADLTTVLDPGETIRLKLIPNVDGFLYIAEGARLVASGAVQRLKPFETPELRFSGSGQRQIYVMFSRRPQTVEPQALGTLVRGNLVESPAEQERATYVVSGLGDAAAQQVIVPVTLTYR
jgi:hypothetical protein